MFTYFFLGERFGNESLLVSLFRKMLFLIAKPKVLLDKSNYVAAKGTTTLPLTSTDIEVRLPKKRKQNPELHTSQKTVFTYSYLEALRSYL